MIKNTGTIFGVFANHSQRYTRSHIYHVHKFSLRTERQELLSAIAPNDLDKIPFTNNSLYFFSMVHQY
ncbi:hypothetical protein [Cylindrospermopsis raciborskii]|uniref:hypothetical protein n=1 Tax=Cylindrospermopsis raciborskii TaxID=77022 RepID=UPI0022C3AFBA|nr:hypothetical protein [Cylindrospermopsis raciborskii]MCZ2207324.1 hypothetical protein [Cylindrospermopsis raciborskii PAMP2011]